jgi:hypothetical protein
VLTFPGDGDFPPSVELVMLCVSRQLLVFFGALPSQLFLMLRLANVVGDLRAVRGEKSEREKYLLLVHCSVLRFLLHLARNRSYQQIVFPLKRDKIRTLMTVA